MKKNWNDNSIFMVQVLLMIPPSFWGALTHLTDHSSHYRNVPLKYPSFEYKPPRLGAHTSKASSFHAGQLWLLECYPGWGEVGFSENTILDLTFFLQPHNISLFPSHIWRQHLVISWYFQLFIQKNFDRAFIMYRRNRDRETETDTRNDPLPLSSCQTEVGDPDLWTGTFLENLPRAP